MQTSEVIVFLEVPFSYAQPKGTGNETYLDVLSKARWVLDQGERSGLLAALRVWIAERRHPQTWMATELAGEMKLFELRPELVDLRGDIAAGKFEAFDVRSVDSALSALDVGPKATA